MRRGDSGYQYLGVDPQLVDVLLEFLLHLQVVVVLLGDGDDPQFASSPHLQKIVLHIVNIRCSI